MSKKSSNQTSENESLYFGTNKCPDWGQAILGVDKDGIFYLSISGKNKDILRDYGKEGSVEFRKFMEAAQAGKNAHFRLV